MNTYALLFVSLLLVAGVGEYLSALVRLLRSPQMRACWDELRTAFDDRAAFALRTPAPAA
jgi:hypothetical protein